MTALAKRRDDVRSTGLWTADQFLDFYVTRPAEERWHLVDGLDNLYCLTVDQDSVHVTLWSREEGWARSDLRSLDDVLRLPALGFEARLGSLYEGTPLAR